MLASGADHRVMVRVTLELLRALEANVVRCVAILVLDVLAISFKIFESPWLWRFWDRGRVVEKLPFAITSDDVGIPVVPCFEREAALVAGEN